MGDTGRWGALSISRPMWMRPGLKLSSPGSPGLCPAQHLKRTQPLWAPRDTHPITPC